MACSDAAHKTDVGVDVEFEERGHHRSTGVWLVLHNVDIGVDGQFLRKRHLNGGFGGLRFGARGRSLPRRLADRGIGRFEMRANEQKIKAKNAGDSYSLL